MARRDSLSLRVQSEFNAAALAVSHAIYAAASSPRFTEAVIWQNRGAWRRAIKHQLRKPTGASNRAHKRRQHEELIAIYLQRYCMKNDTIGFFGPVGWAHFVPEGEALEVRPGPGLLATRTVDFEGWCIDALAESLARDQSLRPWLAPRRLPFVGLAPGAMTLPGGATIKLPPKEAAVLAACDGQRTAKEVAAGLMSDRALAVRSEAAVYQCLDTFCKRGVIAWTLEVPLQRRADQRLRSLLEGVRDERLRRAGLSALNELEEARERIAAAAGEPEKLELELQGLEERFIRLTGKAATRAAGQTYGARTLVYEDCRRDIEVEVGPAVLEALAAPLSLLLQSVRWMTYELAEMYRGAFRSAYTELAARTKSSVVSAADFWIKCQPLFYKDETRLADRVVPLFQQRWAEVLGLQPGARRVNFS
ncbi:MAG: lantibiotic dehydratase, partial [Terriglobales bacterium]